MLVAFHPLDEGLNLQGPEGLLQLVDMVSRKGGERDWCDRRMVSSEKFEGASGRILNKDRESATLCQSTRFDKNSGGAPFLRELAQSGKVDGKSSEEGFPLSNQRGRQKERFSLFLAKLCGN